MDGRLLMTRALEMPENQLRAIIRAARKEGASRLDVKIGETVVTVFPNDNPQPIKRVDEKRKGYL